MLPMWIDRDAQSDLVVLSDDPLSLAVIPADTPRTLVVDTISDAGPGSLRQAILDANANEGLKTLNLADTRVTDAGLVHLASMTSLEAVNLSNDEVTDAGLAHLGRMTHLMGIDVSGTKVTDAGLVHLKGISKRARLNVTGTAVTEQGVKDAKKFLPFFATVTR